MSFEDRPDIWRPFQRAARGVPQAQMHWAVRRHRGPWSTGARAASRELLGQER